MDGSLMKQNNLYFSVTMHRARRIYITILFSLLAFAITFGQRTELDSLHYMLEHADTDLEQIDVLLALSRTHMLGEPPMGKGMDYAEQALEIAERIADKAQIVNASLFITMMKRNLAINNQGDFAKIRQMALESGDPNAIAFSSYLWVEEELYASQEGIDILVDIIETYGDQLTKKNYGNVLKSLGWQYELTGQFELAEQTNLKAIQIFRTMDDDPDIIPYLGRPSAQVIDGGHSNLIQTLIYNGQLYAAISRYDDAIASGSEAYERGSKSKKSDQAWTGMRYADILTSAGRYNEAIDLYIQSVKLYRELDEPAWIASALINLGSTYRDVGDIDQALIRYEEAYEYVKDLPNDRAHLLRLFADLYERMGDNDKAIEAYIAADSLYQVLDNDVLRTECQFGIAAAEQRQGYSERAIDRIKSQLPLLEEVKDKDRLYTGYERLAEVYVETDQLDDALYYAQLCLDLSKEDTLDHQRLKVAHLQLSDIYEKQEALDLALYHHKMYRYHDDRHFLDFSVKSLKAEQVRQNVFDYQKEKEQAEQIATILSRQNKIYLIVAGLLAALLAVGTYLFLQLRRTRAQLSAQNLELQELNHTKDRFFGIIAHDLRSPIIALESVDEQMSYFMAKGKSEKVAQLSTMVGRTARRLNSLLDNLLNWALIQTGNIPYRPARYPLIDSTSETIALLQNNAAVKGVRLLAEVPEELQVYADERAVQTILRNLLSNAIKFCAEGDQVSVRAEQIDKNVQLIIADTGQGMSQDQIDRIYSIDKQSHKGTAGEKGTGLGLILVRDLVRLNKGQINIHSKLGEGTTVSISLPSDQI